MLLQSFKDRLHELVQLAFEKCRQETRDGISKISADYAVRRFVNPIDSVTIAHDVAKRQIDARVSAVWKAMQGVLIGQDIAYSDTLAGELKELHAYYCPVSLWELPSLYESVGETLDERQRADLLQHRERAMRAVAVEIDLFVDGLHKKAQPPVSGLTKEREQKFGILLSPAQAERDFLLWERELGGQPIGVLYLDIDRFKDLNTKHTETTVDRTILPEFMKLLAKFANFRGGCYRQGGDEFVVILPNHDAAESLAFGEKLRATFATHEFRVESAMERLTVSVGVACWPEHGKSFTEVLQVANAAKQVAKKSRDSVVLAETSRRSPT
jgi:diguanylate cyclase (GGDEF)-like protein